MWLPILATDLIQISLRHFWVQIHVFKACFCSNVLGEGVLLVHRGALSFNKRTRSPGRMNAPWSDKVNTIQGQSDTVGTINPTWLGNSMKFHRSWCRNGGLSIAMCKLPEDVSSFWVLSRSAANYYQKIVRKKVSESLVRPPTPNLHQSAKNRHKC